MKNVCVCVQADLYITSIILGVSLQEIAHRIAGFKSYHLNYL